MGWPWPGGLLVAQSGHWEGQLGGRSCRAGTATSGGRC